MTDTTAAVSVNYTTGDADDLVINVRVSIPRTVLGRDATRKAAAINAAAAVHKRVHDLVANDVVVEMLATP